MANKSISLSLPEQALELLDMMAETFEMNRTQFVVDMLKSRGVNFIDLPADPDDLGLDVIYAAVKRQYKIEQAEKELARIDGLEALRKQVGDSEFNKMLIKIDSSLDKFIKDRDNVYAEFRGGKNE